MKLNSLFIRAVWCCVAVYPAQWSYAGEQPDELKIIAVQVHAMDTQYPVNSIHTNEEAESIVTQSEALQQRLQNWYVSAERHCYDLFFVNNCLKQIKIDRRQYLPTLQRMEIEAKAVQRQLRIIARDQELAQKQTK
ncbi:hypothetical protein [Undibacterium oligocarboniphilum]|uniref:Uncharacterized protein n=1 Tax=Undibacterium oligocarboniphilum TaxID=666702 RepID=A0A850QKR0_9BURK|nr:hypothetical protein [Undibacterium oligocarboniphilum]MBC3868765.1 hypothetical protein [Undibacterium oligocarboniphilum]NVO76746.1 hypothetical protein [Undibacterium oligocarboniphilum]